MRAKYADSTSCWNGRAQRLNERLRAADLPVRVANLSSVWTLHYTQPSRYNWMLQYYLRAEGLALSWVGTGRFIFQPRLLRCGLRRRSPTASCRRPGHAWIATAGGGPTPALTNKAIRRRVLQEMLRARGRRPCHRVDQLPLQQVKRRLPVEHDVVERVGDDLGDPHEPGLHVPQEEQVHGAEQQAAEADGQPDLRRRARSALALAVCASKKPNSVGSIHSSAATAPRSRAARPCAAGCSRP